MISTNPNDFVNYDDESPCMGQPAESLAVTSQRISDRVLRVDVYLPCTVGARWYLMLRSDAHVDSDHNVKDLELRHLEWARSKHAGIVDIGDVFDLMGSRNDPRRSGKERWSNEQEAYFDGVVSDAAKRYAPYADLWLAWFVGNHETSVVKQAQFSPTSRLIKDIQCSREDNCRPGELMGYRGWVQLMIHAGQQRFSRSIYCHHGSGGGGAVTKGVIATARVSDYIAGADYVVSGHVHEAWSIERCEEHIHQGDAAVKACTYLSCPGYKDEWGVDGFHVERGRPPKPLGAWALCFTYRGRKGIEDSFIRLK